MCARPPLLNRSRRSAAAAACWTKSSWLFWRIESCPPATVRLFVSRLGTASFRSAPERSQQKLAHCELSSKWHSVSSSACFEIRLLLSPLLLLLFGQSNSSSSLRMGNLFSLAWVCRTQKRQRQQQQLSGCCQVHQLPLWPPIVVVACCLSLVACRLLWATGKAKFGRPAWQQERNAIVWNRSEPERQLNLPQ